MTINTRYSEPLEQFYIVADNNDTSPAMQLVDRDYETSLFSVSQDGTLDAQVITRSGKSLNHRAFAKYVTGTKVIPADSQWHILTLDQISSDPTNSVHLSLNDSTPGFIGPFPGAEAYTPLMRYVLCLASTSNGSSGEISIVAAGYELATVSGDTATEFNDDFTIDPRIDVSDTSTVNGGGTIKLVASGTGYTKSPTEVQGVLVKNSTGLDATVYSLEMFVAELG